MKIDPDFEMSTRLKHVVVGTAFRFRHLEHCSPKEYSFLMKQAEAIFYECVVPMDDFDLKKWPMNGSSREGLIRHIAAFNYKWTPMISRYRLNHPKESVTLDQTFVNAKERLKEWERNRDSLTPVYLKNRNNGD